MKKLVAASIALAALVGAPASAADMPVRTPAPKEPAFTVYNWTGFYVGIQGGSGWSHAVQTDVRPFTSDNYQPNGGVIGGTLGYNAQFGHVVLGLEGDGSGSWIKGYTTGTDPLAGNCGGASPAVSRTSSRSRPSGRAPASRWTTSCHTSPAAWR